MHVQLLKIDSEGYKLKVLEGAIGILQKGHVKNIVIELQHNKHDDIRKVWDLLFNKFSFSVQFTVGKKIMRILLQPSFHQGFRV